jgi:hypothetical protein
MLSESKIAIYHRKYRLENIERVRLNERNHNLSIKRRAFCIVCKTDSPRCFNCGCDRLVILELNHVKGGGYTSGDSRLGQRLYHDIMMGRRNPDDFDVRCRVCNALHYLELRHGKLPFRITYDTQR